LTAPVKQATVNTGGNMKNAEALALITSTVSVLIAALVLWFVVEVEEVQQDLSRCQAELSSAENQQLCNTRLQSCDAHFAALSEGFE
jgi:hypothetical protein